MFVANGAGNNVAEADFRHEKTSVPGNNWININLSGNSPNRFGVGAVVYCSALINGISATQRRQIVDGDAFGNTSLSAHFGIGDATVPTSKGGLLATLDEAGGAGSLSR